MSRHAGSVPEETKTRLLQSVVHAEYRSMVRSAHKYRGKISENI